MDMQRTNSPASTILRLNEVLRRTGLSRSTLYNRISRNEFPHQISLGGRAIGWLEREVDGWIGRRIRLRPTTSIEFSEDDVESAIVIPVSAQEKTAIVRPPEPISFALAVND